MKVESLTRVRIFVHWLLYPRGVWLEQESLGIVYPSSPRCLQSKTQVYGLGDGDFYRTRLTHSIEVQQIAWSIVSVLKADESTQSNGWEQFLPSASLISTVCLAHDLGHPPFGHSGEEVLNGLMEKGGGFDANAQTFRILTRLEKYVEGFGMNLTRRTLLGVLKYPFPKADFLDRENKFIFAEDNKALTFVLGAFSKNDQKTFKTPDDDKLTNMSLDATIMDLADEIAYTIHDLEDAAALGLLDKERWEEFVDHKKQISNNMFHSI